MKKWLVAYVRLHHEKKTAERLTAMNIENFLPVQEEIRQWTYRKKKIERVVIPMMIFVHVDAAERSQVLTLSAISRYMVLHGEHTPAVIPDDRWNGSNLCWIIRTRRWRCVPRHWLREN